MATQESKIRKVIFNEVNILITVVVFFGALICAYYDLRTQILLIRQDVTTIKTNELVHVQDELKMISDRNILADNRQNNMEIQITRILTIMGKE